MASDILKNLIEQKIDIFASTFGDGANNIFKRDNKLIHPLEYGMYKERCAKELLAFVTDTNVSISDGFLITANNNVSTQCDIVMYRNTNLPLIKNGIANFYPIELVAGIGEIKSTLDKTSFSNALVKLSKNKMMFAERKGTIKSPLRRFKENDEIFSFLICNKLSFNIAEIDFDEVYKEIPDLKYRHNAILSLQDGLITYSLDFKNLPQKQMEYFISVGGEINESPVIWNYSHHTEEDECYKCNVNFIELKKEDKYDHIINFLIIIKSLLKEEYEYDFDLTEYLTTNIVTVFPTTQK